MQQKTHELFVPLPVGQVNWDAGEGLVALSLRLVVTHQQHSQICRLSQFEFN